MRRFFLYFKKLYFYFILFVNNPEIKEITGSFFSLPVVSSFPVVFTHSNEIGITQYRDRFTGFYLTTGNPRKPTREETGLLKRTDNFRYALLVTLWSFGREINEIKYPIAQ